MCLDVPIHFCILLILFEVRAATSPTKIGLAFKSQREGLLVRAGNGTQMGTTREVKISYKRGLNTSVRIV